MSPRVTVVGTQIKNHTEIWSSARDWHDRFVCLKACFGALVTTSARAVWAARHLPCTGVSSRRAGWFRVAPTAIKAYLKILAAGDGRHGTAGSAPLQRHRPAQRVCSCASTRTGVRALNHRSMASSIAGHSIGTSRATGTCRALTAMLSPRLPLGW
ncbi:hypothetical protein GQ600_11428 [Phytophthora cactorum]|nr:hypothetical protein GQ600_11428 [Phytophthora cactorum]